MPEQDSPPEAADFVAKVLLATRRGAIEWSLRDDTSRDDTTLVASLDDGYALMLDEVDDFDGTEYENDHLLSLTRNDLIVLSIDRRVVSSDELSLALGEPVRHSFTVFSELWRRAWFKAKNISEQLGAVNKMLAKRIKHGNAP